MDFSFFKARLASKAISILPMTSCHGLKSKILRLAGIQVGKNTQIWSSARFYGPNIKIGDNCFIGYGVQLFPTKTAAIEISNGCNIGTDVIIHTGGHHLGPATKRTGQGYSKSIFIGDGVRISTRSIILEGAMVGAGSQIAAGAVVIKDIPENTLVGGVPAKIIKTLPPYP